MRKEKEKGEKKKRIRKKERSNVEKYKRTGGAVEDGGKRGEPRSPGALKARVIGLINKEEREEASATDRGHRNGNENGNGNGNGNKRASVVSG